MTRRTASLSRHRTMRARHANQYEYGADTANTALARALWAANNPELAAVKRPVNPPKLHPELAAQAPKLQPVSRERLQARAHTEAMASGAKGEAFAAVYQAALKRLTEEAQS